MDYEAELTRMAIEEIIRDRQNVPSLQQERKINPLVDKRRRPNKEFLGRTLLSINSHNRRADQRTKERCLKKLRKLDSKQRKRHFRSRKRSDKRPHDDDSSESDSSNSSSVIYEESTTQRQYNNDDETIMKSNADYVHENKKEAYEEAYLSLASITYNNHIQSLQNYHAIMNCAINENIQTSEIVSAKCENTSRTRCSSSSSSVSSLSLEDSESSHSSHKYGRRKERRFPSIDLCSNTSADEEVPKLSTCITVDSDTESEKSHHTAVSTVSIQSSLNEENIKENLISPNPVNTESENITIDLT